MVALDLDGRKCEQTVLRFIYLIRTNQNNFLYIYGCVCDVKIHIFLLFAELAKVWIKTTKKLLLK